MVTIKYMGERRIKVVPGNAVEMKKMNKFLRVYNPVLKFTKAGKNHDIDCRTSILHRNVGWIGSLQYIVKNLKKYKIPYKIQFKTERDVNKNNFLKYINNIKTKYPPRPYQIKAVWDTLKYGYVTGESITGSGKSYIISVLTKIMIDSKKKVLVIVPKTSLVEQMYNDMVDYFGSGISVYLQKIDGDYAVKLFKKDVIISTWQTLQNKAEESFLIFDAVIADECDVMHKYDSKYRKIVMSCENANYILGMTGTMPEEHLINYHNIVGVLGRHIVYTTEKKLMKDNIISNVEIKTKKLYYPPHVFLEYLKAMSDTKVVVGTVVETRSKKWFTDNVDGDYDEAVCDSTFEITETTGMTKFMSGEVELDQRWFKTKTSFQREIEFISSIVYRMEYLAKFIDSLDGNVLILTSFKEFEAMKYIDYFMPRIGKRISYIDGSIKTEDRSEMFHQMEITNNNLMIALRSTMDRGVSINNLQHLVLVSSIKNASTIRQMIGRILRLDGKNNSAICWDIVDCIFSTEKNRFSQSMNHYIARKKTYLERGFKLSEENIKIGDWK